MAGFTSTTLVFKMENDNPDSKSVDAGQCGDPDGETSSDEAPDDSDSLEDDDDGEDLDESDDGYDYESEYEFSISSGKGKNIAESVVAGDGSGELDAFRAEWLEKLRLGGEIQEEVVKIPEELPETVPYTGKGNDSDGLSVSRLWVGDDDNGQGSVDPPSSLRWKETLGIEMDEFEQEQLLQEEMWKYYAANPQRNDGGITPRYIDNSYLTSFC